jgi:hypothetical protein
MGMLSQSRETATSALNQNIVNKQNDILLHNSQEPVNSRKYQFSQKHSEEQMTSTVCMYLNLLQAIVNSGISFR